MNNELRILLVEDVDITIMVTKALIRSINKEIIIDVAETGNKALELAHQNKYSLIFMDIGLPDVDGLTVSETIRSTFQCINKNTPIIVLTGNDEDDYRQHAKEIGIEDYLLKPLEKDIAIKLLNFFVYSQI